MTTVLDARWLGKGGAGTFTRSLVSGLGEVRPEGRWLLWGPADFAHAVWPGAVHVPTDVDPAAWFGQRCAFRVPCADMVLHPHQTRPVHRLPAATCVLDFLQLLHPSPVVREAMLLRLRLSIHAASALFTISSGVRDRLIADFHVDPASVTLLHLPVDAEAANRVAARRAAAPPQRVVLAVGRFAPHKNHRRLIDAFVDTRFAATGGQLHLVGGTARQLGASEATLPAGVRTLGVQDQAGLEDALAGALVLVQPSLAEGYCLPVAEALLAGVPVTSSPVPAVTEFGPAGIPVFDPTSTTAMGEAIDETVDLVDEGLYWKRVDRAAWAAKQPTPASLAREVLAALAHVSVRAARRQ